MCEKIQIGNQQIKKEKGDRCWGKPPNAKSNIQKEEHSHLLLWNGLSLIETRVGTQCTTIPYQMSSDLAKQKNSLSRYKADQKSCYDCTKKTIKSQTKCDELYSQCLSR